jgi:hypothetical protein
MGSDSDEDKYYASQESGDEEEPRPLHNGLPFHSLKVRIILPAALKMRMVWQCVRSKATTPSVDIAP